MNKKYFLDSKKRLRTALFGGEWKYELVIHHVKFSEELAIIENHGKIHRLDDIVNSLSEKGAIIQSASGSDLLDLIMLGHE